MMIYGFFKALCWELLGMTGRANRMELVLSLNDKADEMSAVARPIKMSDAFEESKDVLCLISKCSFLILFKLNNHDIYS